MRDGKEFTRGGFTFKFFVDGPYVAVLVGGLVEVFDTYSEALLWVCELSGNASGRF